jgi:serine/threonine protein kinase
VARSVEAGTVLAGRYRIDGRLGRGATGEVWAGRDLRLRRDVAVKVLRAADPDEEEVSRFAREATVAAGLQHPGITVVFDADVHNGRLFIVTELLSGNDLGKVLAAHPGGLLQVQVLDLGAQLADALAAAHGREIVHRDLKPANLFVQADERLPAGRLKVCDFGLAKDMKSASIVTVTGEVFGTPAYMAPEQWRAAAPGPAADLYATGCILYEMVTGRVPFAGQSLPELMAQHLDRAPIPPRDLKPGVPAALNDMVLSLLSKEAASRPASAREVLAVLTGLQTARPRATPPRLLGTRVQPRLIRVLAGHTDGVLGVAFSPDGAVVATSSGDETASL